jgi:transposase
MSAKRYTKEFKFEAVKQVVERNYKIGDVADRLGVTTKSIHNWIDKYGKPSSQHETSTRRAS